jgi:hypothetical protein
LQAVSGSTPSSVKSDLQAAATDLHAYAKSAFASKAASDALAADWAKLGKAVESECRFPLQ